MKITAKIPEHLTKNISKLTVTERYCHSSNIGSRPTVERMATYEFIARERLGSGPLSCQDKDMIEIISIVKVGSVTLESVSEAKAFKLLVNVSDYFTHYGSQEKPA